MITSTRQRLKDEVRLRQCLELARLGTCARRKVACVIVDRKGRIIAEGYNGAESGASHCASQPCAGAGYPSGQGLDECEAIHAEQNALIQLVNPEAAHTVYCTTAPCLHCIKMLGNTGAERIMFLEDYPTSDKSRLRWLRKKGRTWEKVTL